MSTCIILLWHYRPLVRVWGLFFQLRTVIGSRTLLQWKAIECHLWTDRMISGKVYAEARQHSQAMDVYNKDLMRKSEITEHAWVNHPIRHIQRMLASVNKLSYCWMMHGSQEVSLGQNKHISYTGFLVGHVITQRLQMKNCLTASFILVLRMIRAPRWKLMLIRYQVFNMLKLCQWEALLFEKFGLISQWDLWY